jgi:hypothetical protein
VAGVTPTFNTGTVGDTHLADTSAGPDSFGLDTAAAGAGLPPPTTRAELAWEKVEAEIMLLNVPGHQIATVWHPDARGDVVTTAHGNVRVQIGDTAEYQLSTGEKIAL